jgi:predicted site-specific integrase-resolvase
MILSENIQQRKRAIIYCRVSSEKQKVNGESKDCMFIAVIST